MTNVSDTEENVPGLAGIESLLQELLLPAGEESLEVRRLFFARDNADFNFLKSGGFKPLVQIAFGETEPAVAVKFVCAIELMPEQVQNHDLAARFDNFLGGSDGFGWFFGVVQGLAEDGKVNTLRLNRRVLQVTA